MKELDNQTEQILEQIAQLRKLHYPVQQNIAEGGAEENAIVSALNKLADNLREKEKRHREKEEKANEIMEVLLKTTILDFSQKIELSSRGDELDAIALGINTMSEELESYIASEKKSKDEIERAAKEIEQFLYIASHDLQEPLRTISNYVGLVQKQLITGKPNDSTSKYIATINTATGRMQLLIRDLLNYSRIGHDNNKQPVDCSALLTEIESDLAVLLQESEAKITKAKLPVINAYPAEMKSIFQNLISNAIKYSKPGIPPVINITARENETEWLFAVKDNGIGIENMYYDRIFVIFQKLHPQKQYPGTGIGLAHCKKIAELHGGKIWVESEPDKGSTFYFSISK